MTIESVRAKARRVMSDGRWHTGLELARRCGTVYATGLMSYIRKLRLPAHGGHRVLREYDQATSRRVGRQVHRYRLVKKAG